MPDKLIVCHKCSHAWSFVPPLGRRDMCPACQSDSRVCRNCVFFDPGSYRECREEQAEWVKEKDRGNFCGWFDAKSTGKAPGDDPAAKARAKLEAAFSGIPEPLGDERAQTTASLTSDLEKFLKSRK